LHKRKNAGKWIATVEEKNASDNLSLKIPHFSWMRNASLSIDAMANASFTSISVTICLQVFITMPTQIKSLREKSLE